MDYNEPACPFYRERAIDRFCAYHFFFSNQYNNTKIEVDGSRAGRIKCVYKIVTYPSLELEKGLIECSFERYLQLYFEKETKKGFEQDFLENQFCI